MLGELLDDELEKNTMLELPSPIVTDFEINPGNRPEYKLFQLEKNSLKSYDDVVFSRSIPKLSIFGQGGYGRPGLNFLDNTFQPYYIVGLNLSWNPINWNRNDNEIQINQINRKIVDIRKETFDKNLEVSLEKYKTEISKLEGLIEKDNEIIKLKSKILSSISSQLQNGIITATDYLTELNSENQAKIMLKTHKVQLIQAKIDFLTLKGN
jgi:outer membrane protein TolC